MAAAALVQQHLPATAASSSSFAPAKASPLVPANDWYQTAIIYQIRVECFADGRGCGNGDLRGVINHLDHISNLGINCIWLGPICTSPMLDGGYDVADYRTVDPSFGTNADFLELVQACHARGIRVILDHVANHTSTAHVWYRQEGSYKTLQAELTRVAQQLLPADRAAWRTLLAQNAAQLADLARLPSAASAFLAQGIETALLSGLAPDHPFPAGAAAVTAALSKFLHASAALVNPSIRQHLRQLTAEVEQPTPPPSMLDAGVHPASLLNTQQFVEMDSSSGSELPSVEDLASLAAAPSGKPAQPDLLVMSRDSSMSWSAGSEQGELAVEPLLPVIPSQPTSAAAQQPAAGKPKTAQPLDAASLASTSSTAISAAWSALPSELDETLPAAAIEPALPRPLSKPSAAAAALLPAPASAAAASAAQNLMTVAGDAAASGYYSLARQLQRVAAAAFGSPEEIEAANQEDYYIWTTDNTKHATGCIAFPSVYSSVWMKHPESGYYVYHSFYEHQVDLNYASPAVRAAILDIIRDWLARGVDGLRVDAAPFFWKEEGTRNLSCLGIHKIFAEWRRVLAEEAPHVMLLAEAVETPRGLLPYFGKGDEFHMAYHFPLMSNMYLSVARGSCLPLKAVLEATVGIPPGCQWALFLRSHDELNLEYLEEREREDVLARFAPNKLHRVHWGIRRRLAPMVGDERIFKLMVGLLLALPGTPIIYYGDEIGMGDRFCDLLPGEVVHDRDAMRNPMHWTAGRHGGFSSAELITGLPVKGSKYGFERCNVADQMDDPGSLLNWHRAVIAVRQGTELFGKGSFAVVEGDNERVLAFLRQHVGRSVLVVANMADAPQAVRLQLPAELAGAAGVDMLGGGRLADCSSLRLPRYGLAWFDLGTRV